MKIFHYFIVLVSTTVFAQSNTEVYLLDLHRTDTTFQISNFRNISNNPGYDSQPSFISNNAVVFAGTQNGQTEIIRHDIVSQSNKQFNAKTSGGEYSPQLMPDGERIAAVRLDTTGLQRLYAYTSNETKEGNSEMLFKELEVAYYAFYDAEWVVASVLSDNQLDLVIANIPKDEAGIYVENSGRSIHKVPNTSTVSYTLLNEDKNYDVYVVDVAKAEDTYYVCTLPIGIQDHTWLDSTTLLLGSGAKLYMYDLYGPGEWLEVADLSEKNIKNITRITVSPDKKKIALVAEEKNTTPEGIVNAHIGPFNEGNLNNFANAFTEDVLVSRFPADTMYMGRAALKANYERFFENNENWNVSVKDRMVFKDFVIDEEAGIVNDIPFRQITVYQTKDTGIGSMNFIKNKKTKDPLPPILAQMEAYNNRDIDAFMDAYADGIELYNYPNNLLTKGKENMKRSYSRFFTSTPDLNYTVSKRFILGNIVIDKELITANDQQFEAIAIYEVAEGKIVKVTFLQ